MAADVAAVMLLLRNGSADETGQALMQGFIWGTCAFAADSMADARAIGSSFG